MTISSIEENIRAEKIRETALDMGFITSGILDLRKIRPESRLTGALSLLVIALPYGNTQEHDELKAKESKSVRIAPFAQKNYYAESVYRLKNLAHQFRKNYGGQKSDYRILCNSPIPEKPLAEACGLGQLGRNGLIITKEAGSLVILAAMTLPFQLPGDEPIQRDESFPACRGCDTEKIPPCVRACPTGALRGDGKVDLPRCIQWYASGNGEEVPQEVAEKWGKRLYGCTACQDACPWNQRPIPSASCDRGLLPEYMDAEIIETMNDTELRTLFKGSAMGLSWLTPATLRRSAHLAMGRTKN